MEINGEKTKYIELGRKTEQTTSHLNIQKIIIVQLFRSSDRTNSQRILKEYYRLEEINVIKINKINIYKTSDHISDRNHSNKQKGRE